MRALDLAVSVANKSKHRHKHGAVIFKNGRVISQAVNYRTGDPENGWRASSCHAEIAALKLAGNAANGAVLAVARVNNKGC